MVILEVVLVERIKFFRELTSFRLSSTSVIFASGSALSPFSGQFDFSSVVVFIVAYEAGLLAQRSTLPLSHSGLGTRQRWG